MQWLQVPSLFGVICVYGGFSLISQNIGLQTTDEIRAPPEHRRESLDVVFLMGFRTSFHDI